MAHEHANGYEQQRGVHTIRVAIRGASVVGVSHLGDQRDENGVLQRRNGRGTVPGIGGNGKERMDIM